MRVYVCIYDCIHFYISLCVLLVYTKSETKTDFDHAQTKGSHTHSNDSLMHIPTLLYSRFPSQEKYARTYTHRRLNTQANSHHVFIILNDLILKTIFMLHQKLTHKHNRTQIDVHIDLRISPSHKAVISNRYHFTNRRNNNEHNKSCTKNIPVRSRKLLKSQHYKTESVIFMRNCSAFLL